MYAYLLHAHQKIDRVAYRHFMTLCGSKDFPHLKKILHFEGKNGPDSAKLKRGGHEQPWHFYTPYAADNERFLRLLDTHYKTLVTELKKGNETRAAFEASWLAHALVDGLTPAHHYPYESELEVLRGEGIHTRTSLTSRAIVKGDTARDSISKSYRIIGPKGLLMTHTAFEAGAAMIILPLGLEKALPTEKDLKNLQKKSIVAVFEEQARIVADLDLYQRFYKKGWMPKLARDVREELAPIMAKTVTLAWYAAALEAGLVK